MRCRVLPLAVLLAFFMLAIACEQQKTESQQDAASAPAAPVVDMAAGKTIAEQTCAACHGVDGANSRDGAPFLAGQQAAYMATALQSYKDAVRKDNKSHETLSTMSAADIANVAAYYNSLTTEWNPQAYKLAGKISGGPGPKAIEAGRQKSPPCHGCHGETGNSVLPGVPTLAGLQYDYIKAAVNAYFSGDRKEVKPIMQNFKHSISQTDIANLAAFFSTQTPLRSALPVAGDAKAGEKAAQQQCAGCHGIDGNSINPTMPSLTGQNQEYLIKAIKAYRAGERGNDMMRTAVSKLSDGSIRNLSAYFAAQEPGKAVGAGNASDKFDPVADGGKLAASCNGCHGANGNSANPGIPSLSRLHPVYLRAAIKAYRDGARQHATMKSLVSLLSDMDIENVSLYYALQEPEASGKAAGKPEAQELAASCNGCHGENGNSTDPEVPSLAGQDAQYLASAIAAYAGGSRVNETMANAVKELNKTQIRDVTGYYASLTPQKPQGVELPLPPQELAAKCDRCHGEKGFSQDPDKPRLAGQIQGYLEKALHNYHDGTRESTTMHAMAAVLSLAEIKAIAAYYSSRTP